jgi:putative nucleotidyltransferase with HDIG domain
MNPEKLEQVRSRVKDLDSISTAPVILQPLLEIMRMPAESIKFDKVVELVSCDGAIAAQCLRLANSPLFARREVESVRSAIMALGLQRVRSMLFGLCMNQVLPKNKWVFEPDAFWRHSLGCALVTQRMAQKIGYAEPEKAYLGGLLHDLGLLVNSLLCNEDFHKCRQQAIETHRALHLCEEEVLGFAHTHSGRMLAEHWRLPQDLCEVASGHHNPELLPSPNPLACLVHLADLLCRVRYLGYGYDEILSFELGSEPAWQTLVKTHPALAEMDVARFTMDIDGAMDQIVATVDAVFGTSSTAEAQAAK